MYRGREGSKASSERDKGRHDGYGWKQELEERKKEQPDARVMLRREAVVG